MSREPDYARKDDCERGFRLSFEVPKGILPEGIVNRTNDLTAQQALDAYYSLLYMKKGDIRIQVYECKANEERKLLLSELEEIAEKSEEKRRLINKGIALGQI